MADITHQQFLNEIGSCYADSKKRERFFDLIRHSVEAGFGPVNRVEKVCFHDDPTKILEKWYYYENGMVAYVRDAARDRVDSLPE